MSETKFHLLYLCAADSGGVSEYAIRQCRALASIGVSVSFVCRPSFDASRLSGMEVRPVLPTVNAQSGWRMYRLWLRIRDAVEIAAIAAREVAMGGHRQMLIACYSEYFAPFWTPVYRRLAKSGIPIATIAHDPVRDFVLGPRWWHRWSVRQAYSFVTHVFVHDDTPVDFGGPKPAGVSVHMIPHGPFEVGEPRVGRDEMRQRHGFGPEDLVFLSFGQIRDGKNLDRFLRAMVGLPHRVKLLVAGSSGGDAQRRPEAYQEMARDLGVAARCSWDFRYIPEEETADLFAATDLVLMTYSSRFRSASGVLNTAVACRRPVLASSGDGPLKTAVVDYGLGVFVPPDDDDAILEGARCLLEAPPAPDWERYKGENSWEENAKRVRNALLDC